MAGPPGSSAPPACAKALEHSVPSSLRLGASYQPRRPQLPLAAQDAGARMPTTTCSQAYGPWPELELRPCPLCQRQRSHAHLSCVTASALDFGAACRTGANPSTATASSLSASSSLKLPAACIGGAAPLGSARASVVPASRAARGQATIAASGHAPAGQRRVPVAAGVAGARRATISRCCSFAGDTSTLTEYVF